jgi:hypothetical protein
MNIQKYQKKEIAFNYIETALSLFFEEKDLFSVITLAGAAEELLGQLVPKQPEIKPSLRSLLQIMRPKKRPVQDQDEMSWEETEDSLHMDTHHEAVFLLGRAIEEYGRLSDGQLSEKMQKFNRELRRNKTAAHLTRAQSPSRQ